MRSASRTRTFPDINNGKKLIAHPRQSRKLGSQGHSLVIKRDMVKKLANGIQRSATKIDGECAAIGAAIHRLLAQALAALGGTGDAPTEPPAWAAGAA